MLTPSSGLCLSMQRNCGVCWLGQSGIIIRLQLWQFIQLSLGCCFTGCKIHFSQAVRGRDTGWLPWSYCTEGCRFLKNTCSPARNARDDGLQVREFFFWRIPVRACWKGHIILAFHLSCLVLFLYWL